MSKLTPNPCLKNVYCEFLAKTAKIRSRNDFYAIIALDFIMKNSEDKLTNREILQKFKPYDIVSIERG